MTTLMHTDEQVWIDRAKAGDPAAFEVICQRYERQIYSLIYRMLGDPDDAYDVVQEVFVKAYQALGRTNDQLNLSAWLFRIASNACLDTLRRRQRIRWLRWDGPEHDHLLPSPALDEPERSAITHETRVTVQRVLDRMTPRHRLALLLREYEELGCAEIGDVMGLSRSAVKSLLFRAREEFRRLYPAVERPPQPASVA